jgi:hypothetical protein
MSALPRGRIRPARDVVFRELGGEMVLLNLKSGVYFGLNETGTQMWTLLVELKDPGQVVEAMEREFTASRAQLEGDLRTLLGALRAKGLIEFEDE